MQPVLRQLSQNQKLFSEFFSAFPNLHKIRNTLKKNMSLKGYFFLKL